MALVGPGIGVKYDYTPIPVPIGDIDLVALGIDHHARGARQVGRFMVRFGFLAANPQQELFPVTQVLGNALGQVGSYSNAGTWVKSAATSV